MKFIFSFLFLILLIPIDGNAQVNSEWRGIGRTGVYNESGLQQEWSETGPALLWSVQNLPKGNSSLAIGQNCLFITGIQGEDEVLTAIDNSRKILWQIPFGKAWGGSYPESRATPTIENNRIYVSTGSGEVVCVSAIDGKTIWKVNAEEKFSGKCGNWGFAESLLLVGDKVIYTPGGEKTTVVAFNKQTGETIWISESLNDPAAFSSPILITYKGVQQILATTKSFIIGISPVDGKISWKFDFSKFAGPENRHNNATTPLYSDGKIYVTSGYNHAGVMLTLNESATETSLVWSDNVLDNHHGGVVKVGNYIYGSNWLNNGMGKWVCLDWNNGSVKYEQEWINKGSIIAAEGNLYCYEEKTGMLALVKVNPEKFDIISSFKIPFGTGPHWAHPVIHNKILYVRHGDALMAYDISLK